MKTQDEMSEIVVKVYRPEGREDKRHGEPATPIQVLFNVIGYSMIPVFGACVFITLFCLIGMPFGIEFAAWLGVTVLSGLVGYSALVEGKR